MFGCHISHSFLERSDREQFSNSSRELVDHGWVVQKPVNVYPGLNVN